MEIVPGRIDYGLGGRAFHAPYVQVTDGMTPRAVVSRDAEHALAAIRAAGTS
jgi:hypothetical protein